MSQFESKSLIKDGLRAQNVAMIAFWIEKLISKRFFHKPRSGLAVAGHSHQPWPSAPVAALVQTSVCKRDNDVQIMGF